MEQLVLVSKNFGMAINSTQQKMPYTGSKGYNWDQCNNCFKNVTMGHGDRFVVSVGTFACGQLLDVETVKRPIQQLNWPLLINSKDMEGKGMAHNKGKEQKRRMHMEATLMLLVTLKEIFSDDNDDIF